MSRNIANLTLSKSLPKAVDVVVLGLVTINKGETAAVGVTADLDKAYEAAYGRSVMAMAKALGASPTADSVTTLPALKDTRILVVGLEDADVTPERLRRATGNALRTVIEMEGAADWQVAVSLEASDPELVQATAEGAVLGAYRIEKLSEAQAPSPVAGITVITGATGTVQKDALAAAAATSAAVCQARDWINTPPNLLYPATFAEAAKVAVRDARIAIEILDEKALEKAGYGGILAVGGGSAHPPRLVRLSYAPRGARRHLALVGKGITFDSGGLDLKPAGQMAAMKCDMSGAAAVISAIRAIADLGLKVKVTAYAAMAENMPSGSSYRASDVLTMFDGQRVENYNTDAEGRLVMADAIGRAAQDSPDLIVDVATLTGACMVALGMRTAGLMTNGDVTTDRLLDAAEAADEDFWELPITEHTRTLIKSSVADLRSGSGQRWGGAVVAGAFLERFVPEGIEWAHLDIAGPAESEEAYGYVAKGGTGMGVRTLIALAAQLAEGA